MCSNDYKKETAQEWAQNPLSEQYLYFVNYLCPSNNSQASFTVFYDSNAVYMNSYLTSYDACADANKMAQIEHVNRARVGRPKRLTASATKRNQRTTLNVIEVESLSVKNSVAGLT